MEQGLSFSPALGFATPQFYEYLLVVHPAKEVYEKVEAEKERFSSDYNVSVAKSALPHITVANFLAKEEMEETVIKWMHRILSEQRSFNVELNNYSGFPPHTVYARKQEHQPFRQLAASLKVIDQYVRNNGCPPAVFITRPYLTIARRLQANVYEKAMFDYARKTFHATFIADELVLLKRQSRFDKCRQVNVFKLTSPSFPLQRRGRQGDS
jgi:2'-5' RNA ligase